VVAIRSLAWGPISEWARVADVVDLGLGIDALADAPLSELFVESWKGARRLSCLDAEPEPALADFASWLAEDPVHHRPLFAVAFAIQMALSEVDPEIKDRGVMQCLAQRELASWQNEGTAAGLAGDALGHLRSMATITGGLTPTQLQALANDGQLLFELPAPNQIINRLTQANALVDGKVPPIEPDLLGAAVLVVCAFGVAHDSGDLSRRFDLVIELVLVHRWRATPTARCWQRLAGIALTAARR